MGADRGARSAEPPESGGLGARRPRLRAVHPRWGFGEILRKLFAPLVALGFLIVKFGGLLLKLKVVTTGASMLVSIAAYAWIWGLPFAVGFVAPDLRPRDRARDRAAAAGRACERAALHPVPRRGHRDEGAAGRRLEGGAGRARRARSSARSERRRSGSPVRRPAPSSSSPSAFVGFFLNLFNLIPIVPLDGGRAVGGAASGLLVRRAR